MWDFSSPFLSLNHQWMSVFELDVASAACGVNVSALKKQRKNKKKNTLMEKYYCLSEMSKNTWKLSCLEYDK